MTGTDEQSFLLPLNFTNGVAEFDFIADRVGWICAVPGKTSQWFDVTISRAVVAKAAV